MTTSPATPTPAWDDLLREDYLTGRRPAARHRAEPTRRSLRAEATAAAVLGVRDALRAALVGTDTPPRGLSVLADMTEAAR